eukprot:TRINITY_DN794_c0_g1_i1.p1 TRINITY_DN794_c0_g1~~TRINITY_DN794_c0_g1_i1.p1  ORF type:complete len:306 (+),score=127.14 TRINITY_DN794_c0_g1_i1:90-1007(+)
MGKKPVEKEEEEEESMLRKVVGAVGEYVFSLVIPVAILLYAAPQKSTDYILDSVKSKVSFVETITWEDVTMAITSVYKEVVPLVATEVEMISSALQHLPYYFNYFVSFVMVQEWKYVAAAAVLLLIVFAIFPWRTVTGWLAKTLWRSVSLCLGLLPLEDGADVLTDREAGNYRIAIVGAAVIITLIGNYAVLTFFWWFLRYSLRSLKQGIKNLIFGKKKTPPTTTTTTTPSSSGSVKSKSGSKIFSAPAPPPPKEEEPVEEEEVVQEEVQQEEEEEEEEEEEKGEQDQLIEKDETITTTTITEVN